MYQETNDASKTILIIDDEDDVREIACLGLEMGGGWGTISAGSGREGIELAKIEQPDAILLDVMMPDMDGYETFETLQNQSETTHIPVIFITAKIQPSDRDKYSQLGAAGVLSKPFRPMELTQRIIDILHW